MSDVLFKCLENFNGGRPWGQFLDAGTGVHSLKWLHSLPTSSWTAITADNNMRHSIESDTSIMRRECDRLLVGNWMDAKFRGSLGKFDTILADYLIGAVDGFSPYEQDVIIEHLKEHLNPDGRLYIIGMNPIPDHAPPPSDLIGEVRRARDACILLAGHRPYREFPLTWMERHLKRSHLKLLDLKNFTILHSEESTKRQLRVAASKLPLISSDSLRIGMDSYLKDLEVRVEDAARSSSSSRIPLSFDYVIAATLEDNIF